MTIKMEVTEAELKADPVAALTKALKKLAGRIEQLEIKLGTVLHVIQRVESIVAPPPPPPPTPEEIARREQRSQEIKYQLSTPTKQLWEDVRRKKEGLPSLAHLKRDRPPKVIPHDLRKALAEVGLSYLWSYDPTRIGKDE